MSASLNITLVTFGAVFCLVYLVMALLDRQHAQIDARLREVTRDLNSSAHGVSHDVNHHASIPEAGATGWWAYCELLLPKTDSERQLRKAQLVQAGKYDSTALSKFFLARLVFIIIPFVLTGAALYFRVIGKKYGLVFGATLCFLGVMAPTLWLRHTIARRQSLLRRALADWLDLMIICLDSGLSVPSAVQRVADEIRLAHPVLADEMGIVQRDIELGATVDVALRNLADRSALDVLRALSSFMRDARRFGSQLAEALRSHADMLRHQREQAAEENAQKAAIKMLFPTVLLILPAVFVVLAGPAAIRIQEAFSK